MQGKIQNNATSTRRDNTEEVLVGFLENVLGIEDAKNIEFQRINRLGKPKNGSADGGRTISGRFVRFSDRERVFKQGRKLKGTNFRIFEDIPKDHIKRERYRWEDWWRQGNKVDALTLVSRSQINYLLMELYIDKYCRLSELTVYLLLLRFRLVQYCINLSFLCHNNGPCIYHKSVIK